jgi:hypothetical protein
VDSALKTLKRNGVSVDISKAKDSKIAERTLEHLSKLTEEYNSTLVSFSIEDAARTGKQELGTAYMLNGRTNVQVLNRALREIKAADALRLEKNQPLGVTYHEFAHALSQSKEKVDKEFWKEIRKLKREYQDEINSPDWFSRIKISDYASTNVDEFMAEALAQAKLSRNPSPYSLRVLEVIEKYFKKS